MQTDGMWVFPCFEMPVLNLNPKNVQPELTQSCMFTTKTPIKN